MISDITHAARMLIKYPAFTLIAVLTLAVGIGANTAIFTVVNGVLLRPLPYPEPDRIVQLWEQTSSGTNIDVSFPNFADWRDRATAFEGMAAYSGGRTTVVGGVEPVFADVYSVTREFFGVLSVAPQIGRSFNADETRSGGPPAAVVGYDFWKQTLGGNQQLDDLRVRLSTQSFRIVGVMPRGFAYPADAEIWISKERAEDTSGRTGHNFSVIARLRPGVALAAANAELDGIATQILRENPGNSDAQRVAMKPLHTAITGASRTLLLMLVGAVGLVLLIACVNVASTLLARGEERRKELAIRAALGAARGRLVRQLLTENLLLSVAGATGGLLVAAWLMRVLLYVNPTAVPRPDAIRIDLWVLLFAVLMAAVTPLLFGLVPSIQVSRTELRDTLSAGGRAGLSPFRARVRNTLVGLEAGLALLLLVGSLLLTRSFWNVITVDTGFAVAGVIAAETSLPGAAYPDATRTSEFYRDLLVQIRAMPGVRAAGAISDFPFGRWNPNGTFVFERDAPQARTSAIYRVVTPGYFEAMGVPLVSGRPLGDQDVAGAEVVAVVNQDFVRKYITSGDALGRRFKFHGMDSNNEPTMTIVGVVGNTRGVSLVREVAPEVFVSSLQRPRRTQYTMTIAVRPEQPALAESLVASVREVIRSAEPGMPVEFSTLEERIGQSVADRHFVMLVLALFAAIALLLAAVGIYGVLTYSVAQRTQEIGVRMALGADPSSVVGLMLRDALLAVGAGMLAGVAAATFATHLLQAFLYEVEPIDPLGFGVAVVILGAVAWVAAYIPARRATRVDPLVALR